MFLRRFFFLTILVCVCALFGESLLLSAVSGMVKLYFRQVKGIECSFSSLVWKDRNLVFSDIVIRNEPVFSFSSDKAIVSLFGKHIHLKSPLLHVDQIPSWGNSGSSVFSFSATDGQIQMFDLAPVFFSFHLDAANEIGTALLSIEKSSIDLNMRDGSIDVVCHEFPISYLNPWLRGEWTGLIDGAIHFGKVDGAWSFVDGTLDGKEIGYGNLIHGVFGKIDWEGFLAPYRFNEGRVRFSIVQGNIDPLASDMKGSLSFDGKSGAKWEFSFSHEDQTIQTMGRGFFHSLQGRWIESHLRCGESALFIHGYEDKDRFVCDLQSQNLHSHEICWLQDLAALFGVVPFNGFVEDGIVSGSAEVVLDGSGRFDWTLFDGSLEKFRLRHDRFQIGCETASLKEGLYRFEEGFFVAGDALKASGWKGEGSVVSSSGLISGQIGDQKIEVSLVDSIAHLKLSGVLDGEMALGLKWNRFSLGFKIDKGSFKVDSSCAIDELRMQGEISAKGLSCFNIRGLLDLGKKVPFYCPIVESEGIFDIRFEYPFFDLARLVGTSKLGMIQIDRERSHFFGSPVLLGEALFSNCALETAEFHLSIPWQLFSFFYEISPSIGAMTGSNDLNCKFSYEKTGQIQIDMKSSLFFQGQTTDFDLHIAKEEKDWKCSFSSNRDGWVEALFQVGKGEICLHQGKGGYGQEVSALFTGKITAWNKWDLNVSKFHCNSSIFPFFKRLGIEGVFEGEGLIHSNCDLEADFDLKPFSLNMGDWTIQNDGVLQLYCSSKKGVSVRGVNLSSPRLDPEDFCKMGLLQYNFEEDLLVLTQVEMHVPPSLFSQLGIDEKWLAYFEEKSILVIADVSSSSDFSRISLSMKEAEIPIDHTKYHLQNFHFDLDHQTCVVNFDLDHQSHLIPINCLIHLGPCISGKLNVENGMDIAWTYQDDLQIQSIRGKCLGVEGCFHLEGDSLIGRAQINGNELKTFLPEKIAQVFDELRIGDGYQLMGRLRPSLQSLGFKGVLSGKQIELFGFVLGNIFANIEWDANYFEIKDLKMSDFAGILKVDHILAQGEGEKPWTISIPHIRIFELRPSLLQEVGGAAGKLSPLVIRELKIDDFQGVVSDGMTYTAKGDLYFINSYKRESSILEIPSDFLSRIIGLDLDLLVPVCGTLRYELQDGFFHFTALEGSFSENNRSEFFLVFNKDSPKMDLDWNLKILIQMKQFVLFKFTEAFIISVSGKLDDPKFQLHRKKRFLGVL